jgi:hypothetical protein
MKMRLFAIAIALTALLVSPLSGDPQVSQQAPQQIPTLAISGHTGSANILKVNGKSYVAVEDLARMTQASLSFKGNQTVLTLPHADANPPADTPPPVKQGFSRGFMEAGIEQMGDIREWRVAIVTSIEKNYPISADWVNEQRRKAEKNLALASAAVSTDDDRSAYPLLAGEFANMTKLSDRFLAMRSQAQYIDPSSLRNDPLDQQILTCSRALATMAADNKFRDEFACR